MKEIIDKIDKRFEEALKEQGAWVTEDISALYSKIKNEVFLEYLNSFVGK